MGKDLAQNATERVKKIVERIQETTAMTAYQLTIVQDSQPNIFDSKFGGVPYWDLTSAYPVDANGEKMMLLAQINFTAAELEDERLPQEGMLQFFISADDDCYGIDWDESDSQKNFRVIYHEAINSSVTEEDVLDLDIPVATDKSDYSEFTPVFKEARVEITKKTVWLGTEVCHFDKIFAQTVKEVLGEDIKDQNYYKYLDEAERDYLYNVLSNAGHWLLGYPYFTQGDPREYREDTCYDTLLFQMDSDAIGREDYVLWGDCGVANFFINKEALKNKDFSKVMYTWDCC
ncbi:MAG: DUF1963 domain-containing protein [Lachnospiraceae bacterium]|nr:DUF1963 domain-containing protein [Lachnospiraceae bacterium]